MDEWKALHQLGELRVQWVIEAATRVHLRSGVDTVPALASFLAEMGLSVAARPRLAVMATAQSATLRDWAARVLERIGA